MPEDRMYILNPSVNPHRVALFYEPTEDPNNLKITLDLSNSNIRLNEQEMKRLKTKSTTKVTITTPRTHLLEIINLFLTIIHKKCSQNARNP